MVVYKQDSPNKAIRMLFEDGSILVAYGRIVWAGVGEVTYLNRDGKVCEQKNVRRVWQGRI